MNAYVPRQNQTASTVPPPANNAPERTPTPPNAVGTGRRNQLAQQINNLNTEFVAKKDQYFNLQLRKLQEDLSRLHDGTHADFNAGISDLLDERNEALYTAREHGLSRLKLAELEYEREIISANEEYETTKHVLRSDLLTHLQNKKRKLETDKNLADISVTTTIQEPLSPSLAPTLSGVGAIGSRKLRHRVPVSTTTTTNSSSYPLDILSRGAKNGQQNELTTKTALDEVLENLGDTIKQRHFKSQAPQNEDRVRDRIEREREKLVRGMLIGVTTIEGDNDLQEIKRKYVPKKGSVAHASGSTHAISTKKVRV